MLPHNFINTVDTDGATEGRKGHSNLGMGDQQQKQKKWYIYEKETWEKNGVEKAQKFARSTLHLESWGWFFLRIR